LGTNPRWIPLTLGLFLHVHCSLFSIILLNSHSSMRMISYFHYCYCWNCIIHRISQGFLSMLIITRFLVFSLPLEKPQCTPRYLYFSLENYPNFPRYSQSQEQEYLKDNSATQVFQYYLLCIALSPPQNYYNYFFYFEKFPDYHIYHLLLHFHWFLLCQSYLCNHH